MTYNELKNITNESLRDWFKKEKWVRISSSGNIAGDCGTSKNKENPDRCLPKAKAQSLTKGERAATAAKKKKAGSKGKTVVKNTKKATVKKEGLWANINAKKKAGKKSSSKNSKAYKSAKKAGNALEKTKNETTLTVDKLTVLSVIDGKRNLNNDHLKQLFSDSVGTFYIYTNEEGEYENTRKIKKQDAYKYVEYYNARLKKDKSKVEKLGAELGVLGIESELQFKVGELSADPSFFSTNEGDHKPIKMKIQKEDLKNLVTGLLHEMKSNMVTLGYDLEAIQDVVDHLRSNYIEGQDYELHIGRGDDLPNAITFPRGEFRDDHDLNDMLNVAQSDEDRYDAYTDDDLNEKKDDRCTRLAKQKYDTWPSAYASGAVVRCRRGDIWKKK